MADFDFTAVPRLTIPEVGVVEDGPSIRFTIQTISGPINVSGFARQLTCRGDVAALADYGLLRPDWLPGLPGNNKVRQTIILSADGPKPIYGKSKTARRNDKWLTIARVSSRVFEVEFPVAEDQEIILKEVSDRYWDQLRRERDEAAARANEDVSQKYWAEWSRQRQTEPLAEVRSTLLRRCDFAAAMIEDALNDAAAQFDEITDRAIKVRLAALCDCIAKGALTRTTDGYAAANVVLLRR